MFEMIVATAGAGGVRIEITADVEGTAYPGQPINYTFKISGVPVGKKVYWSMYEDYATKTVGADRLYDGVTSGVLTVTGLPITVSKRVLGETLQGRKLMMRAALTAAEADNPDTALASSPEIVIGKSPTGSSTASFTVPANVYALTVSLSGAGGGGSGGAPSGSFRYYTGGKGGNGVIYSGVVYVKPGTTVSLSKGTGGQGRGPGLAGQDGGGTSLSGLVLPSATVSGQGGGGGGIGDNQTGVSGRVGSPNGSGAAGGAGGARDQGTGGTGSPGYGTLTWGL